MMLLLKFSLSTSDL